MLTLNSDTIFFPEFIFSTNKLWVATRTYLFFWFSVVSLLFTLLSSIGFKVVQKKSVNKSVFAVRQYFEVVRSQCLVYTLNLSKNDQRLSVHNSSMS